MKNIEPQKRRKRRKKKTKKKEGLFLPLLLLLLFVAAGTGLGVLLFFLYPKRLPGQGGMIAEALWQFEPGWMEEVWEELQPEEIPITSENAYGFAEIEQCEISTEDISKVVVSGTLEGIPESDDRLLYLFSLATYEDGLREGQEPITSVVKYSSPFTFEVNLNYKQAGSRLFDKFVVAIKQNDKYTILSKGKYITNPEAMAKYQYSYPQAASIKGLLVDPHRLGTGELEDLGVKQAAYNIMVGRLVGSTSSANYPTIHYDYNGKTYSFNGQTVAEYDIVFSNLTAKGIQTTAIILNDWNGGYLDLVHPKARSQGKSHYYMFNAADKAGVDYLAAVGTFLAERYSGTKHGQIVNWVIANEVNARTEWNHYESTDVNSYTVEYAKGFRVFYNAIKSVNACAKIYIPIDQTWNRNLKNNNTYDGRDVLDIFNQYIKDRGNIDWDLSQHPYPVPLTHAAFWNMPANYRRMNLISYTADSPMVSMTNINVVTDYLQREEMLNPEGKARSVILSEVGFTSTSGESVQAAAYAYAYYIAEANSHIDGLLLNRQTDAPEEIAQGLALGLCNTGGGRKQVYEVFKKIDTAQSKEATEFAKPIIGISSWSDVIKQY